MTGPVPDPQSVAFGRRALHQLRASLERHAGAHAPAILQEAGFAGGEALHAGLTEYVREHFHVDRPEDLDARHLGEALSGYFSATGWGALGVTPLSAHVVAIDSPDWAEAAPSGTEYPTCHYSTGALADLFTRLGGGQLAVMEVECRSRGDDHCRFLLGAPEVLTRVYERMVVGERYEDAVA